MGAWDTPPAIAGVTPNLTLLAHAPADVLIAGVAEAVIDRRRPCPQGKSRGGAGLAGTTVVAVGVDEAVHTGTAGEVGPWVAQAVTG